MCKRTIQVALSKQRPIGVSAQYRYPFLSQIPIDVGAPMKAAIDAVPYASALKIGLQFKRRFWEEDEAIYGGISYTDLPIGQVAYPNTGFNGSGRAVLLGAISARERYTRMNSPRWHLPNGSRARSDLAPKIHPQYSTEFENGIAVAWHRVPFTLGCARLLDRKDKSGALRQSMSDRWTDRARRRARILYTGMAGRRRPLIPRCRRPAAQPRYPEVVE